MQSTVSVLNLCSLNISGNLPKAQRIGRKQPEWFVFQAQLTGVCELLEVIWIKVLKQNDM